MGSTPSSGIFRPAPRAQDTPPRRRPDSLTSPLSAAIGGRPKADGREPLFKHRITRANPFAFPLDRGLPGNPNKGATRSKRIGIPFDWTQPLRIEKWIYPRRIRPAYFLICPGQFHHGTRGKEKDEFTSFSASSASSVVNRPPPLSSRPPGREHPSTKQCPQRVLKLMMVQATEAEIRDADLAELWIDSLPGRLHHREPFREHIARLIDRYGPIMQPRVLLCPRCLGAKYGNNPETVRQGWRRRNSLPDTSIKPKKKIHHRAAAPDHQIAKSPDAPDLTQHSAPSTQHSQATQHSELSTQHSQSTQNFSRLIVPLNHFTRSMYEFQRARITGIPPGPGMEQIDPDDYARQKAERCEQRRRDARARQRKRAARRRPPEQHRPPTTPTTPTTTIEEALRQLITAMRGGSPHPMRDLEQFIKIHAKRKKC